MSNDLLSDLYKAKADNIFQMTMMDGRKTYYFYHFQTVKYHTGIYLADAYLKSRYFPTVRSYGITYYSKMNPFYMFNPPEIHEKDIYIVSRNDTWNNRNMDEQEQIRLICCKNK